MANHDYLDFDLELAASDAEFFAHVIQSPGGQGRAAFQLQRDDELLLRFLDEMGRRRRRGRQEERITIAKLVGGNLFRAVFQGDVLTCWRASVNIARERDKGLRLRLRLNHAPALADLPWELLYDPSVNRFFHLSNQFPLVRYLEMPDPPAPLRVTTPLRVLAMLSLPSDYDELRVELEYQQLDTALRDLQTRGIIELHRLPKADLGALRAELRAHEYHILHFIGHGEFDEQSKMGALVLENERGMGRRISGETLGVMLRDEKSLRLVVLNACEGARPDLQDAFGGVAQSLIQQGIPSVIAMQFEITDQAARKFSQEFYSALTTNFPIEAALAEARKALYELPTQTEWVTPVLYSRAPDGVIFNVQIAPAASPPPPPPQRRSPPKRLTKFSNALCARKRRRNKFSKIHRSRRSSGARNFKRHPNSCSAPTRCSQIIRAWHCEWGKYWRACISTTPSARANNFAASNKFWRNRPTNKKSVCSRTRCSSARSSPTHRMKRCCGAPANWRMNSTTRYCSDASNKRRTASRVPTQTRWMIFMAAIRRAETQKMLAHTMSATRIGVRPLPMISIRWDVGTSKSTIWWAAASMSSLHRTEHFN